MHISGFVLQLTGSRGRTRFAWLIPSFAHVVGAAAHLLGHVERQLVFTRVIEVAVANTLPHVCVMRKDKNFLIPCNSVIAAEIFV